MKTSLTARAADVVARALHSGHTPVGVAEKLHEAGLLQTPDVQQREAVYAEAATLLRRLERDMPAAGRDLYGPGILRGALELDEVKYRPIPEQAAPADADLAAQPRRSGTILDRARDALNARMTKDNLLLVLENTINYAADREARAAELETASRQWGERWQARCDHLAKQGLRWKAEADGRKKYGEKLRARVAELEAQVATARAAAIAEAAAYLDEVGSTSAAYILKTCDVPQRAAEDPCHPCGCPKRFDRHAWGCPTEADTAAPLPGSPAHAAGAEQLLTAAAGVDDEETHVVDYDHTGDDPPECIDECPGCEKADAEAGEGQ
ncbi:hypothetical protein [Streptomyces sp. MJP52]|uniref:hypothetical protein n=1 Tax=Streptomyces sp. MJP52 TaxID=2940555 RepID=UPI0024768476|nr:hypothetical protein [Streptomyces sp. MJP52]MDH6224299.1 BMFP domain-containing protein YqiC [Streptomyces sp. MJP52]